MPEVDEGLETQDQLDVEQDAGDPGTPGAGEQENEPFLKVNERSIYRTKEDAVRAYDEAGRRIAQLSNWEKAAKQYGLDDPSRLGPIFDDYLKLKDASKVTESKGSAKTTSDPASELNPEQKKALDWLKKSGAQLGYVPKEEVETLVNGLREQIEELKGQSSHFEEQRFKNQEAEARSSLTDWLKESKIEDAGGSKTRIVGTLVKDWINSDDELIARWREGGVEARNLVREGFNLALKELGWVGSAANATSNYAVDKAKSVAGNKKLPAPGTAAKKGEEKTVGPKQDKMASLHEKAFEEFSKVINDRK